MGTRKKKERYILKRREVKMGQTRGGTKKKTRWQRGGGTFSTSGIGEKQQTEKKKEE